ncbi:MAG TPA: L-threonylcarbamoyladenylate synthase [Acidobacteriaceae bacterium]|nr:L-threonylcarbamoyladenylate synthase [Acidobacteriaceae bacterium]
MADYRTSRIALPVGQIATPEGQHALRQAATVLRGGGTVAFATETVYGLGANALEADAVEKIFRAKDRPGWDPLIVHVSNVLMLERVIADVSPKAQRLMDAFWPGPLTLLLPRNEEVPAIVTAGRALVGVRMPSHPVAHALIELAGVPVAAPSANRFGYTSPTTAQHVLDDLDGRIDLLLDSGAAWCGVESTVVEARESSVTIYRPGAITAAEIGAIAEPVIAYQPTFSSDGPNSLTISSLPSPGVGIRHYAPRAVVILIEVGNNAELLQRQLWLHELGQLATSVKTGAMLPANWPLPTDFVGHRYDWGQWNDDRQLAENLFAGLRWLDSLGAQRIVCPLPPENGLGSAIRDRLQKAARPA